MVFPKCPPITTANPAVENTIPVPTTVAALRADLQSSVASRDTIPLGPRSLGWGIDITHRWLPSLVCILRICDSSISLCVI